jgi:hypothetical protein
MRESGSASRALSVPVLNDSSSAKSTETTANDRLLHFMAQPPKVEKHGEFGVTSHFVIEVQPLFIRNSFQQFFACVPSYQPKSLLFKPKWIWNKIPAASYDLLGAKQDQRVHTPQRAGFASQRKGPSSGAELRPKSREETPHNGITPVWAFNPPMPIKFEVRGTIATSLASLHVINNLHTSGKLALPGFQRPTSEIPTSPSEHTPLGGVCVYGAIAPSLRRKSDLS